MQVIAQGGDLIGDRGRLDMPFPDLEARLQPDDQLWVDATGDTMALRIVVPMRPVSRSNGMRASQLDVEVHHSDPLEWAHLKPETDPNRLVNLWAVPKEAHAIATRRWAAFSRSLQGRPPTQAELMRTKLDIDREVAPYLRTPGVSVSRLSPRGGAQ